MKPDHHWSFHMAEEYLSSLLKADGWSLFARYGAAPPCTTNLGRSSGWTFGKALTGLDGPARTGGLDLDITLLYTIGDGPSSCYHPAILASLQLWKPVFLESR